MEIKIIPTKLSGEINAISSKSDVHRLIIACALSDKNSTVITNAISKDIKATIDCVNAMGGEITIVKTDDNVNINISPIVKKFSPILNCNESGSTARFLLPIAATLCEKSIFTGQGNLPNRPFTPLTSQMKNHNCKIDSDSLPMTVNGFLNGGEYFMDGNVSSQFISGLMFALPLLKSDSKIILKTPLQSVGYVNMTMQTLSQFGIKITQKENEFEINGNQKYHSNGKYIAEGDWSNSAFWLCAGTINGDICVDNLSQSSFQNDKQIMKLLTDFGADIKTGGNKFCCKHKLLNSINIDAGEIPDLVPTLSAVAAVSNGTTKIFNAKRLKFKESDRLFTTAKSLSDIGADIIATDDGLIINGKKTLSGGVTDSFNDHRIAMAVAIVASACENEVIIKNAQAVEKSYPDFFKHYNELGGKAYVITDRK